MIKKFLIIFLANLLYTIYTTASAEQFIFLSQNLELLSNFISKKSEKIDQSKQAGVGKIGDKSKKAPIIISKEPQAINIKVFNTIMTTLTSVFGTIDVEKFQTTEKKKFKDKAREFLNALHNLVKNTKAIQSKNSKNKEIVNIAALKMLNIDPLLISTVIAILKDSEQPQVKLYEVMVKQFENQIEFLEKEFKEIVKPKFLFTEGVKNDIDEALSYQPAISDEIQTAELKKRLEKDTQATQFINDIDKLQKRLKDLLVKNAKILSKNDIPVESYVEMMETKIRPSCKLACPKDYISIYTDLDEIQKSIKDYSDKSKKYRLSQRILAKQSIINKLSSFLTYLNVKDRSFCQYCLDEDINSRPDYDIDITFALISNFFENLPIYEKNAGTQRAISIAQELGTIMLARKKK